MTDFKTIFKPDSLRTTEMIKEEIINHGPVLSRSYYVPGIGKSDFPVIMGWETKSIEGEGWVVRIPSKDNKDYFIAMGTCNIEDDIVIPKDDLRNTKWQSGAYLSVSGLDLKFSCLYETYAVKLSHVQFMQFWGMSGENSMKDLFMHGSQFEVYDNEIFTSRKARIEDCQYINQSTVEIQFHLS